MYEHKGSEAVIFKDKEEIIMRPKRKESIKVVKNDVMSIRVTKEDKSKYSTEAQSYGMNLSEYVIYLLNHKAVNIVAGGSEIAKAMYDLNCTLSRFEAESNVSADELRISISTCVRVCW